MSKFKIKKTNRKDTDKWREYVAGVLTQLVERRTPKSAHEVRSIGWVPTRYESRTSFGWFDAGKGWTVRCEKSKQNNKIMVWFAGMRHPNHDGAEIGFKEIGFSAGPGGKGDVAIAASIVRFLRTVQPEIVAAYASENPPRLVDYVKQLQEEWEPDLQGQHARLATLTVTPYVLRTQ